MPDSPTRRLKSMVTGAFRPQRSPSSTSQSVPSAVTNIPSTPSQTPGAAVPSAAIPHSTTFPGTSPSIAPVAVASSASGTPTIGVESTSAETPLVDNLTLALDVTEKLASFAQKIPFIAPVADVLSQILKTYKEAKDTDDKRDALLAQSTSIGQDLCATILRMEATNHVDLIGRLRPDIEAYTRLLEEASKFVADYDSLKAITRALGRNELGSKFTELQQDLDSFGARFRTNRLVDLAIQQNKMKAIIDEVHAMTLEKKLEEWLRSPPDMRQKQHETQKLRREGTGRWFLEGNKFIEWQDNPGSLWIQGASGTGKSVLSSSVIEKVISDQQLFEDFDKSSAVAFFYFDFKAKDSNAVETALRRIVLQLSAQSPHPYRTLDKQYQLSHGQALPNYRELLRLLKELLQELGRTYLIFDALDECPDTEFGRLMDLISALRGWNSSPLHFLITSQPRAGFTEELGDVPGVFLESSLTQPDIELFIASELRENRKMKTWASHADDIVHRVVYKSSGMFRLAACLLLELSRCKRQNELDRTLETLPNDLFGIYNRFLESVRPEDLVYVTGVLRWLIFSTQNLTLAEIADAIAFDFSDPTHPAYDPNVWEDNTNAIPDWLEGLATIRDYNGRKTVILAHASVQDYLLSGSFTNKFGYDLSQGHSHAFLARSCMSCLLHFSDHPLSLEAFPNYSLARYAAKWWCHHLRRSRDQDQSDLASSAMLLLEDGSEQYSTLNYLRNLAYTSNSVDLGTEFDEPDLAHPDFRPFHSRSNKVPWISPLHLCAEEGYIDGVRWLLQKGVDINFQVEDESPLQAACGGGHTEIVRLLLESAAEVNAAGEKRGTALQVACAENQTDVVKLLLANGADVNAEGTFLGTALQTASWAGNREVVALLLTNGADINARGRYFGSALQAASGHGNTEIVRLLLDNGAEVDQRGGNYGCALIAASLNGRADPVRLLVTKGANVNIASQDKLFGTFAQAARLKVSDDVVRFLLAKGADINAGNEYFGNALQAASRNGHTEIVRFLLQNGADVNTQDGTGEAALQIASESGHIEIVCLLLENGADINAQTPGTALEAASETGHLEIARVLLENGAAVNGSGGKYGGALGKASGQGHLDIVRLLLADGADVNAVGYWGTPLHSASSGGHIEVIRLLLDNRADVNANNNESLETPLHVACARGHVEIIQLLLENGADVKTISRYHGTPLQTAVCSGNAQIFRLLIEKGAEVNATAPSGFLVTALQAVSFYGQRDIVELLLQNGADVNIRGGKYDSALQAAIKGVGKSSRETVELLLANGADANAQGGKYGGALPLACKEGNEDIVRLLLANGADANAQGGKYGNPLMAACENGNEDIVRILLANGADVNAKPGGTFCDSALHVSLMSWPRHLKIACLLIENGAEIDERALRVASTAGDSEFLSFLLAKGASVAPGIGSALCAASALGHKEIVRILLENGANVNAQGDGGRNALSEAANRGHIEIVRLLLESGADVAASGGFCGSPLRAASASWNGTETVHLLLESGADVNAQSGYSGETALQAALSRQHTDIIHILLENGADVNAYDGAAALQAACSRDNMSLVQLLLERGADVNAGGGDFGTALQAACLYGKGQIEIPSLLLDNDADINAAAGEYGSALQAAAISGGSDLVRFLISKGADVNARGGRYGSPLGAATRNQDTTIMRILLDSGAEIDVENPDPPPLDRRDAEGAISCI